MKNDTENSSKEKRNVINWYTNNLKSSWFPQSWRYDWRQSSRKKT